MKITDLKNYTVVGGAQPVSIPKEEKKTSLGQKVLNAGSAVANFVGAKGITDQFGADIARAKAPEEQKNLVEYPKMKEVVGSAIQTGANLLPGAGKGAGFLAKTAIGAGTGLAFDAGSKLQQGKSVTESVTPGLGTAVGASLPAAGVVLKPVTKIVGRLFKGLGSGLSGVSTETIDKIVDNPQLAKKASQKLAESGNNRVLEENARTIVNGVSTIRQEARKAFGQGVEELAATDIKPQVFRQTVQPLMEKYGITSNAGKRTLSNVEFTDPKNLQKASELVKRLNTFNNFNGQSLRKLSDDIENSAYKIATSDERLSFNSFIRDLSGTLREAINNSTGKLNEINQKFSKDLQLSEAVEDIFGSVNFKNLSEVVKASKKLETMFAQKGLAPEVIDNFLKRIGVSPEEFGTSEAVRQISQKASGANTKGLTMGELTQQATSAVVTPEMIKQISIATGATKEKLIPFLRALKVPARNAVLQALMQVQKGSLE